VSASWVVRKPEAGRALAESDERRSKTVIGRVPLNSSAPPPMLDSEFKL
jgi:hypothetical protein